MDKNSEIRWKQFFDNFEKVYMLLRKFQRDDFNNELERAGYIHYFELVMEHANKLMVAYLEAKGKSINSPREAVKTMEQLGLIGDLRNWFKAQNRRNLPFYIYNEELAFELVHDINEMYIPEFEIFYEKMKY